MAILYLVENQFGLFEDSLPKAVARLLGTERLRSEDAGTIRTVAEDLVREGQAEARQYEGPGFGKRTANALCALS